MSSAETLAELKTRGYYRVNFRPRVYARTLELGQCRDIVFNNRVSLRGWDYPHFPRESDLIIGETYYEGWTNWAGYKELWRLYQSEQFIMLRALREDWMEQSLFPSAIDEPNTVLNVIGSVVYELAEVCEFLARLLRIGLYSHGVNVEIDLNNTAGRILAIGDSRRMPLMHTYRTSISSISFKEQIATGALTPGSPDLAIRAIRYFLARFGWHDPSLEIVDKEVVAYLQRRGR